ncbi:hypothetical protein [Azospirillum sp. TSO22-1]|uniref:hypothetical protein n=1 Tax=Azospirillum sp. TSO22-1 TaxID=716789 RepID=UPI000D60BBB5|nr:hypothetical protein [Azospirillum sp. TSO22-1]PWC53270.1 hypothetical protein TSO221_11380 [Azospirillum sp. TSO22-1]
MRDLMNHIHPIPAIAPVVVTDNTAQVSAIIDTLGYGSLTFVIATGTLSDADATVTALVEDGDASNLSDAAAVADAQLLGTEALASFTYADDGETRKIGYIGFKRYVRLTLTPSGNTGNIPVSAVAILGHPRSMPTSNPPV